MARLKARATAVAAQGCSDCEDAGVTTLYDTDHGTDRGKSASTSYASANITWDGEI